MKAPPAQETIAGDGTGDNASGSTPRPEAARDRYAEEIDPDPRKEISRLIAPAAPKPVPREQPRTAPPRPSRKPVAKEKPRVATTETEPTVKKKEIHCGANATKPIPALPPPARRATVLGHATAAQAAQMIQITGPNGYADQRKRCRQRARVLAYRRNAGRRVARRAAPRRTIRANRRSRGIHAPSSRPRVALSLHPEI